MPSAVPTALAVLIALGLSNSPGCARSAPAAPDSPRASAPAGDGWRDTFPIDTSTLTPSGGGDYFPLRPGTVQRYRAEKGGEELTITVLDETEVVDGVTTRIVEERETDEGELVEVSRNFFAADPATGDVYYFGEDVDMYKDGKVSRSGAAAGAWRSGVNGARFGLLIPGRPKLADRYYQEVAPGVAMDRAEVSALDASVNTPAGPFERCVHLKETTPLESGTSRKWFAPGVGLVKDDDMVLVSRTPAK
ncbi:MAG: hypothetical protein ACKVU4_00535 [Phycisphaerales bacterium]